MATNGLGLRAPGMYCTEPSLATEKLPPSRSPPGTCHEPCSVTMRSAFSVPRPTPGNDPERACRDLGRSAVNKTGRA